MGNKRNVIEINGRRYDAATGKPVKSDPEQVVKKVKKIQTGPVSAAKRSKKPATAVHAKTKKSTTLNRSSTKKPSAPKKVRSSSDIVPVRNAAPAKKALASRVSDVRKSRAVSQAKSESISKFAIKKQEPQAVQREEEPEVEESSELVTQVAPQQSPKEKLIAEQLAQANDIHERQSKQPIRDYFRRRPKLITILATGASTLLIVGYVTYLNIPNMALRVAASRAGFEANMPAYRPDGFSFGGPIAYSPGQITIQFDSNTDAREFNITQRETNWDSQSLLENYVKPETDLYSTFQERGLTVYIYEGSSAAWVNGGIWYTIDGDSLLNSDQLLKIATSL